MTEKKHREQQDTLTLEPNALAELRTRSAELDDEPPRDSSAFSLAQREPGPGEPRPMLATAPSEPTNEAPVVSRKTRDELPTIPFELTEGLPSVRPPMRSEPFELVRPSERPPAPPAKGRLRWGIGLILLVVVAALSVWVAASGLLEGPVPDAAPAER